ncbi:MAG TPA: amidohydrolase, partial [Thermomicrobiales bacterium]|nr:amidohydrolase [Thermomicrobiales bacterium]
RVTMLAITNGKVYTALGDIHDTGTVLIDGSKIVAVGPTVEIPEGTEIVDVRGKVVLPGFVESHSHVGIWTEGVGFEGRELNETSDPITPHIRAIDGINPNDPSFRLVREAGITTVLTGPGSANLIGGEWIALKPVGRTVEDMILKEPAGLKMALGENPKTAYGEFKKAPVTRMAQVAMIREQLFKAQKYAESENPERDLRLEPLVRALRREQRTRIHAYTVLDITNGIRFAKEFGLDPVFEHAYEAHTIADILARENIPVSLGPFHLGRMKVEMQALTFEAPGILARAGVRVAIHMDARGSTALLPVFAGLAVRAGMSEEDAIKAITINSAIISGVDDRVGSLEPGKDADVIVLSGHPFDWLTKVEKVYVNGQLVHAA